MCGRCATTSVHTFCLLEFSQLDCGPTKLFVIVFNCQWITERPLYQTVNRTDIFNRKKTKCGLSTFDAQPGLVWLCILLMKKQKLFLHLGRHLHWSISMYMICKTLSRKRMGFSCCCWLCLFVYMFVSLLQRLICTLFLTTMAQSRKCAWRQTWKTLGNNSFHAFLLTLQEQLEQWQNIFKKLEIKSTEIFVSHTLDNQHQLRVPFKS